MGELSDFQNAQRKKKGCGIIAFAALLVVGAIIFFVAGEFKSSGIFRSGKNSDATSLYQLYPYQKDGKNYLISVEGVFKTRIYERQGGMTTRSGSTDIRVSIHDLESGDLINKTVTGDYHEAMTKILGSTENAIWFYDMENGLHTKTFPALDVDINEEKIIAANNSLTEGLAKTDTYLNNIDELYGINETANAIMVTTISGNTVWLDATTLQTTQQPLQTLKKNSFNEEVDRIVEQAKNGGTIDMSYLNNLIKNVTTDIAYSNTITHSADQAMGADSCIYRFEGSTVRTLQKTDCPRPVIIQSKQEPNTFIEPVFISDYNTTNKQYANPEFLSADACIITHASKMGDKSELLLSKLDVKTQKPVWTTKTGVNLNNHRSSYSVNGLFNEGDTLFITFDHQIFAINLLSGKIIWKYKIDNANYNDYLYLSGITKQNNKTYLLTANSYFTELSRSGIFITGRTDFRLQCIDAKTGKLIKKIEMEGDDSKDLPYYLGMSNSVCWFYTDKDGIHTRSIPDLKIITPFSAIQKNIPEQSELISTSRFGDAQNNNYVTLDEKNKAIYFAAQNGLYYSVNTNTLQVNEIQTPSSALLEDYLKENSTASFYKTHLQNMYHHDLVMQD
ncbi:MAG: PQQ-binding-like beta-propeller repeat protein, partial [Fimbriimonadaceae bacterium]|nr:PQQ-binding-like beta-propeller repeat protein [Chitinophagales bacterium]